MTSPRKRPKYNLPEFGQDNHPFILDNDSDSEKEGDYEHLCSTSPEFGQDNHPFILDNDTDSEKERENEPRTSCDYDKNNHPFVLNNDSDSEKERENERSISPEFGQDNHPFIPDKDTDSEKERGNEPSTSRQYDKNNHLFILDNDSDSEKERENEPSTSPEFGQDNHPFLLDNDTDSEMERENEPRTSRKYDKINYRSFILDNDTDSEKERGNEPSTSRQYDKNNHLFILDNDSDSEKERENEPSTSPEFGQDNHPFLLDNDTDSEMERENEPRTSRKYDKINYRSFILDNDTDSEKERGNEPSTSRQYDKNNHLFILDNDTDSEKERENEPSTSPEFGQDNHPFLLDNDTDSEMERENEPRTSRKYDKINYHSFILDNDTDSEKERGNESSTCQTDKDSNDEETCLVKVYENSIPKHKKDYLLFPDKIRADIMNACPCSDQCSSILMENGNIVLEVQHFRSIYHEMVAGDARTLKLVQLLKDTTLQIDGKKKHVFQGKTICRNKWIDVLGISSSTYYRALEYVKGDQIPFTIKKNIWHGVRGLCAVGFISTFLEEFGDYSPERKVTLIPPCINKKFIFDEYLATPGPHIKRVRFNQLMTERFGTSISFAKNHNINPCDICLKVKVDLFKIKDRVSREQLKKDLKIHLERQRKERDDYYRKRNEAIRRPSEITSLIIDGMDQAKTNLPHFRGWTRPKSAAPVLKTHVTGVQVHGKKNFFYLDLLQWPHDPNLTISCMLKSLCGGKDILPSKLYIQCDNCGRENKNRHVIGFLAYMVLQGYVREAYLSFLLKGHTHEDIDQLFSKISQRLKRINAMTLLQLKDEINNSFLVKPEAEILGCVWDVKGWIDNSLNDISNHSYQHQFWFYCDRPKHVSFKYRRFSTDPWVPSEEQDQLEIFALDPNGEQIVPTNSPGTISPNFEEDRMKTVKSAIQKMKIFLGNEEYQWWTKFIENPRSVLPRSSRWPLHNIKKVHQIMDIPAEPTPPTIIHSLLEAESEIREIRLKEKKKKK